MTFLVTDAKLVEPVLSSSIKHLAKNDLYDLLVPWLGDGLLMSKGQKWHNRRKVITPAFHFKILEQFVEIFDNNSQILVKKFEPKADGQIIEIHDYVSLAALDIICGKISNKKNNKKPNFINRIVYLETAMGTKINAQTDTESSYVKAVQEYKIKQI